MVVSNRRPALAWTATFLMCTYLQADLSIDGLVNELRGRDLAGRKHALLDTQVHQLLLRLHDRLVGDAAVDAEHGDGRG